MTAHSPVMHEREARISIEHLHECFSLDVTTGVLTWKHRPDHHFQNPQAAAYINSTIAGTEVRSLSRGYLRASIGGVRVLAHRIVWAMTHGAWPDNQIDHIDGNPGNNTPPNLRVVDYAVNARNKRRYTSNKSGHVGVHRGSKTTWVASITQGGVSQEVGRFTTIEEAVAARTQAVANAGFTDRHGS